MLNSVLFLAGALTLSLHYTPMHFFHQHLQTEVLTLEELSACRTACHAAAGARLQAAHAALLSALDGLAQGLEAGVRARGAAAAARQAAAAGEGAVAFHMGLLFFQLQSTCLLTAGKSGCKSRPAASHKMT